LLVQHVINYGGNRLIAMQLLILRPSQLTWVLSPPVGCYHLRHPPSPHHHLLLLSLNWKLILTLLS